MRTGYRGGIPAGHSLWGKAMSKPRPIGAVALTGAAVLTAMLVAAPSSAAKAVPARATSQPRAIAAAPSPEGDILAGNANGGQGSLVNPNLPAVTIGKIAAQYMPCVPDSGVVYSNAINTTLVAVPAGAPMPSILNAGAVVNSGVAVFDDTAAAVTEKSATEKLKLLNNALNVPLVSLDSVVATANNSESVANGFAADGSTTFVNLKINGTPILDATPAPNTVIDLGPIGTITLNEQILNAATHAFSVNAIHVHIANLLGYSGDIYIATANTRIASSTSRLTAGAFELSARAALNSSHVGIGQQNFLPLPCTGTHGVELDQTGAGISAPGLATANTLLSAVNGNKAPVGAASTYAIAKIEGLNLLDGRITADAIVSRSNTNQHATDAAGKTVHSDGTGTTFVNLKIDVDGDGTPDVTLNGDVAPNTALIVSGLGRVIINRQTCSADSGATHTAAACDGAHQSRFTVDAVFIKLGGDFGGFTAGTTIKVAEATSGLSS